jgi:hypothetical protein
MRHHSDTPRFLSVVTFDNPEDAQAAFNDVGQVHFDHLLGLEAAASAQSPPAEGATVPPAGELWRIAAVRDRREAMPLPCDDLRQWAVVIWARTKLLERLLAAQGSVDPRLLAGLSDVTAAVAAIGVHLDALEDILARRAA